MKRESKQAQAARLAEESAYMDKLEAAKGGDEDAAHCECCGRVIRGGDTAHDIIQGDYCADVDSVAQDGNARTLICDDCAERVYRGISAGAFDKVRPAAVAALPALVEACEYYLAQLDKVDADLRGAREKIAAALAVAKGN